MLSMSLFLVMGLNFSVKYKEGPVIKDSKAVSRQDSKKSETVSES